MKVSKYSSTDIYVVGPYKSKGGVARSTLNMVLLFRLMGLHATISSARTTRLRPCRVIHLQGPMLLDYLKILFEVPKAIRIMTFHGWFLEEQMMSLRYMDTPLIKRIASTFFVVITWFINKFIFIPFTVHVVTAVSKITANKNGVRAIVVPNPFFDYYIKERLRECQIPKKDDNEIWLISYVSVGGGKFLSVIRLAKIVKMLNRLLSSRGKKVVLYLFGKDVPRWLERMYLKRDHAIRFMGYSDDYLCYLRNSDLFIAAYTMPELGHAVLEAVAVGVPIAKYTENPTDEEIEDGFSGLLAQNDVEMVKKIYHYVLCLDSMKNKLAENARRTLLKRRSPEYLIALWRVIMNSLLKS